MKITVAIVIYENRAFRCIAFDFEKHLRLLFCYYFLFHHVKCLVCASSLRFAIERFSHSLSCVEHYLLQSISNNEELRTLVIASLML